MNNNICWNCLNLTKDNKYIILYSVIKNFYLLLKLDKINIIDNINYYVIDDELIEEFRSTCYYCKNYTRTKVIINIYDDLLNKMNKLVSFDKENYLKNYLYKRLSNYSNIPVIEDFLVADQYSIIN